MTLTIQLQPEIERRLSERAQAKGVSLTDFAQEVLARESTSIAAADTSESPASKPDNLYNLFAPVRGILTDEEVDTYFTRTASSSRPVDFE
jgi:hypothetical protein